MKKALIGLILIIFFLSSAFGAVFAVRSPGYASGQLVTGPGAGQYTFTLTNNGVKAIMNFWIVFSYSPSTATVTAAVNTVVIGWQGGVEYPVEGGGFIVGMGATANKYYLKSSGQNSISMTFTVTTDTALTLTGLWFAVDGKATLVAQGTV